MHDTMSCKCMYSLQYFTTKIHKVSELNYLAMHSSYVYLKVLANTVIIYSDYGMKINTL